MGYGLAKKEQVQFMVARLLELSELPSLRTRPMRLRLQFATFTRRRRSRCRDRPMELHDERDAGEHEVGKGDLGGRIARLAAVSAAPVHGEDGTTSSAIVVTDFTNPAANPSHWILTLHKDGSGHFSSERGNPPATEAQQSDVPNVDRDVQVSAEFADHVFQTARQHRWFNQQCDSRLKVAFQGWKKLSYAGPAQLGIMPTDQALAQASRLVSIWWK